MWPESVLGASGGLWGCANNATSCTSTATTFYAVLTSGGTCTGYASQATNMTSTTSTVGWYYPQMYQDQLDAQTAMQMQAALQQQMRADPYQPPHTTEEAKAKRKEAADRARELLLEHLTPAQRETFTKNGWFVVAGGKSKKRYRINGNRYAGNIDEMHGERVTHRLCCHLASDIPTDDHLLAQKLALESDEDDFLTIANRRAA